MVFGGDNDERDPSLLENERITRGGRFVLPFTVPEVEPGRYPVVLIIYGRRSASHIAYEFLVRR